METIRAIGTDLTRVTETTARALMPFSGKNDKHHADHVAVEAMRNTLNDLPARFRVVLGEGEKDAAPMLYTNEILGQRAGDETAPTIDLVVDPLECTTNFARGLPDSMSVLLASPPGKLQRVPGSYMQQLLVPEAVAPLLGKEIDLDTPVPEVMERVQDVLGVGPEFISVVVQDRPRHAGLIEKLRSIGAGVSLIESGSISAAYDVIRGESRRLQMLWGTFGAPEAIVIAFMARQSGCGFLGRMAPHNDAALAETKELGLAGRVLTADDLVHSGGALVMSGIHGSSWLPGVRIIPQKTKQPVLHVHTLYWPEGGPRLVEHQDGVLVSDTPL